MEGVWLSVWENGRVWLRFGESVRCVVRFEGECKVWLKCEEGIEIV